MNEIVYNKNNQAITNSILVAEKFGKEHKHVLGAIRNLLDTRAENSAFVENQELTSMFELVEIEQPMPVGGGVKKTPMYIMNRDGFTLLAMGFTGDKALAFKIEYIRAFNKMEAYIKSGSNLPKTFAEALRLAADQQERIEAQDRIIREQTPKADYFDNLVERNLLTNFRDTAKQIGLKQNDFIKRLIHDKYIYRDKKNTIKPYSKFVDELFEIKDWGVDGKAGLQTLITPKGKETFRLLYSNMPMPLM